MSAALAYHPTTDVTLRRADLTDRERVFEYNCALGGPDVSYSEHVRWFSTRIADPRSPIWVIEQYGEPVGTVRIDAREGVNALLSIALASHARGRGVGRYAVEAACTRWCGTVTAEMQDTNERGKQCFVACGFAKIGHRGDRHVYLWSP